ncbi:MAG: hypothetical protein SVR94_13905, partial [Pseudomonadota bacterium]|nr:hypothetical protein [Pseudomonadota bacterium]
VFSRTIEESGTWILYHFAFFGGWRLKPYPPYIEKVQKRFVIPTPLESNLLWIPADVSMTLS